MLYKGILFLAVIFLLGTMAGQAQTPPIIVAFESELQSITVGEAEAEQTISRLNWTTFGMRENDTLELYSYEINTWVLLSDDTKPALEPNGSFEVTVRHPLNFNPPTYRLVIYDANLQIVSESTMMIPYAVPENTPENVTDPGTAEPAPELKPEIVAFTTTLTTIDANELAYGEPVIPVSWEVINRTPSSHLLFEQVMPDGTAVPVDFPRGNVWVTSVGSGAVTANLPASGTTVMLRLRLVDLSTNTTLSEAAATLSITGTVSTPTPRPTAAPTNTADPNAAPPPASGGNNPPPVVSAGSGGGFELGGHVAGFGRTNEMRAAGMTWVKTQIRWGRGEGTGGAAGAINAAHSNGFKVLLGVVGSRDQLSDFEGYTNDFAAFLGQVAALGPDAIEVWNEPNIDSEWPTGSISGASYTTMLSKAYNAIKGANPNVMVISAAMAPTGAFGGGCSANGCDDIVFLRQMASAGAASYMDCIGAHYNEGIISPDQTSGDPRGGHYTRYFWGMLNTYSGAFGGGRRVCWTELGYLSPEGYGPLPGAMRRRKDCCVARQKRMLPFSVTPSSQAVAAP